MRRLLPPLLIAGTLVVPAIGASAQDDSTTTTEDTTTTTEADSSTTSAGTLSISAPDTASLSGGTPTDAGSISAALGVVVVQDTRGEIDAAWTATVASSPFVTGSATAAETIGRELVSYWSGAAVATAGVGVFTPGQLTSDLAVALDVPRTAFTMASGIGDNSVSWNPTVIVTIPSSAVTGTYTGTITHSVA